jgi:hypothetical protein
LVAICAVALSLPDAPAATIAYTYDAQHRLVQASYSASEKAFYNYDAAGNVDQHITITNAKYLESWLLWFTLRSLGEGGYFSLLDAVYPTPLLAPWETTLRAILAAKT